LIIDTAQGLPEWIDIISETLEQFSISLSHVFLTHWHGDHTGGVPDLTRVYPHLSSATYKNSPAKGQLPIEDGQVFRVEGATIRAVHSPGHSHDHMCFILEEENAMFTGDNILGHGTSAVEELSVYMTSLRAMQSHNCTLGYPAHGAVIQDLPAKISGELTQKLKREERILKTLEKLNMEQRRMEGRKIKSVTVKELVTSVHGMELDEEVRALALEPFMDEVLRKLAEEGRVGFEMRGGEKKWFGVGSV
jgi:glyoxylase-like metal-dependent hydrolase (beta-lactamase superfamily II)